MFTATPSASVIAPMAAVLASRLLTAGPSTGPTWAAIVVAKVGSASNEPIAVVTRSPSASGDPATVVPTSAEAISPIAWVTSGLPSNLVLSCSVISATAALRPATTTGSACSAASAACTGTNGSVPVIIRASATCRVIVSTASMTLGTARYRRRLVTAEPAMSAMAPLRSGSARIASAASAIAPANATSPSRAGNSWRSTVPSCVRIPASPATTLISPVTAAPNCSWLAGTDSAAPVLSMTKLRMSCTGLPEDGRAMNAPSMSMAD